MSANIHRKLQPEHEAALLLGNTRIRIGLASKLVTYKNPEWTGPFVMELLRVQGIVGNYRILYSIDGPCPQDKHMVQTINRIEDSGCLGMAVLRKS